MKAILILIFIFSIVTIAANAQTQRVKELLLPSNDLNASQYNNETDRRNREAQVLASRINDDLLLILNGKEYKGAESKSPLNKLHSTDIICVEVITDKQRVKAFTIDVAIRKVLIIETRQ